MWFSRFISGYTEILCSDDSIINYSLEWLPPSPPFCSRSHALLSPLQFSCRLYNAQNIVHIGPLSFLGYHLRPLQWHSVLELSTPNLCWTSGLWSVSYFLCQCMCFIFSSAEILVPLSSQPRQGMTTLPLSSCYFLKFPAAWVRMCTGIGCHPLPL